MVVDELTGDCPICGLTHVLPCAIKREEAIGVVAVDCSCGSDLVLIASAGSVSVHVVGIEEENDGK